ncbi:MAG: hypothetical protein IPK82_26985 [Polyangiaceae bacterium]|nr:hypothetical protein [Polyangiaceae bacterium]
MNVTRVKVAPILPPKPRRVRGTFIVEPEKAARSIPINWAGRTAEDVLGNLPWEGAAPDPEMLDAATFLSFL